MGLYVFSLWVENISVVMVRSVLLCPHRKYLGSERKSSLFKGSLPVLSGQRQVFWLTVEVAQGWALGKGQQNNPVLLCASMLPASLTLSSLFRLLQDHVSTHPVEWSLLGARGNCSVNNFLGGYMHGGGVFSSTLNILVRKGGLPMLGLCGVFWVVAGLSQKSLKFVWIILVFTHVLFRNCI